MDIAEVCNDVTELDIDNYYDHNDHGVKSKRGCQGETPWQISRKP